MKLFSKLLLVSLTTAVAHSAEADNEKGPTLSKSSDKGVLDMRVMIEYNHIAENGKKYPTSFLTQNFQVEGNKLADIFKLDRDQTDFKGLRNFVTKEVTGKNLVNAMVTDENFGKALSEYPDYFLEEDIDQKLFESSTRHFYNHNKLVSAILPFYILIGIFGLGLFLNRSKFNNYSQLRFSRTSKVLFTFLIFRLVYDLLYLAYLIVFQIFGKFRDNSFLYYFFLISDQILGLIIFHAAATIFVQGYLTLCTKRSLFYAKQSLIASLLYFLSITCIRIYLRVKQRDNNSDSLTKYVFSMKDHELQLGYFIIFVTFTMRSAIAVLLLKSFQKTYYQNNRDVKFLKSFIIIGVAYIASGYIKFPIFVKIGNLSEVLKNELIGEGDIDFVTEAISIPEIVQIITAIRLIFLWRDQEWKKTDC